MSLSRAMMVEREVDGEADETSSSSASPLAVMERSIP
jgi:hypothetical protein